jgi:hypothetical protein
MNCERVRPILLDYLMNEAPAADRAAIQLHLETCAACSEEAGRCRQTLSHLAHGAAFEEVPQRIRVVAEPADAHASWWAGLWRAPARLAFAASGLACIAIALLALTRTTVSYQAGNFEVAFGVRAASQPPSATPNAAPAAFVPGPSREEVARLVAEAVAASDARQIESVESTVNAAIQQAEQRRVTDRQEVAESLRYFQAAQVNMWKQQVENQQVVAALLQRQGPPAVVP